MEVILLAHFCTMFNVRARPCSLAGYQPRSVCCLAQVTLRFPTKNQFYVGGSKIDDMGNKSNKSKSRKYMTLKHLTEQRGSAELGNIWMWIHFNLFLLYVHVHMIMFYCHFKQGRIYRGARRGLPSLSCPPPLCFLRRDNDRMNILKYSTCLPEELSATLPRTRVPPYPPPCKMF